MSRIANIKPDFSEAAARMDAYWHGEMLNRPVLIASTPKPGYAFQEGSSYHDRAVSGDLDIILYNALHNARGLDYLGESMPACWMSFGTHEIASFFGAEIVWTEGSGDTTWAKPMVQDWNDFLPLHFDEENPNWQRMLRFYRRSAEIFQGEVLPFPIDFHSNMDLLLSLRGDEQLCYDVYDCPELIDRAMEGARETFRRLWEGVTKAGKMDEYGYWFDAYGRESTCVLACDYICMISKEMLHRWFVPTIEYEASFIDHVIFHWDGPGALRHFDDIMNIQKIHTVAFVPNPFEKHSQYLDLYRNVQAHGKGVVFGGTPDEIRSVFHELDPARTIYKPSVQSAEEFFRLEQWMREQV